MSSAQIEIIEGLLDHKGPRHGVDLKMALTRLSVEILERTSKGSSASYDFLLRAVRTVSKMKGTTHADLRLNCLYESSAYFYRAGFARAALQTAELVNKLARRTNNTLWRRKAATLSGIVLSEGGNIAEAVVHYCEALKLARELKDRYGEVAVLIDLAGAFIYGSLHREAVKCLNRAIELCDQPSLVKCAAVAYCNLAQAYLPLEEYQKGFVAIERSLEISEEPRDGVASFSRTIREYTYVQLALELGKLAKAREHATACRQFANWGNNSRCKTLAKIASGLCEIRGGDVDHGLAQLEKVLAISGDFIIDRIDVLNALVKGYEEAGRPEQALRCMIELLSIVRTMREQSIEAITNLPDESSGSSFSTGHVSDVRSLELREARLRAKVAEHELINSQLEMLERLAITADLKEEPSGHHGYRVGRLSTLLAQRLGFDPELTRSLEIAARLHDIGKIAVPDRILLTTVSLQAAQRNFMQTHAVIGSELLGKSRFAKLQIAEQVARHHHECWDGTGYPAKLSGKRIPIHARIVALADVFDALTHGRPYAPAWTIDKALEEIRNRRGTQFDPDMTDTFLALIEDLRSQHSDLDAFLGEASRNSPFLQARDRIRVMLEGERSAEKLAETAAETMH